MRPAVSLLQDQDLLTKDDFDARLAEHGVELPARTMRTWRTRGLMPHAIRGGLSRYPEESVAQAIEAARLFTLRRNEDFVGWELWWGGFEVDQRYWVPVFELRRPVRAGLVRRLARLAAPPITAAPDAATLVWTLRDAIVEAAGQAVPDDALPDSMKRMAAFTSGEGARILSAKLKTEDAVRTLLSGCARAPDPRISSLSFKPGRIGRLTDARDTVRDILDAGAALHDAMVALSPVRAARLKPLKWLSTHAPRALKADLSARWMSLSEPDGPPISPDTARDLRADAFATRSAALETARRLSDTPVLKAEATPMRLRAAMRRRVALDALAGRLRRATRPATETD